MEKIIVENVDFVHLGDASYTFPEIQKHLEDGFVIKSTFFTPLTTSKGAVSGVSITVHLIKVENQKETISLA